MATTDPEMCAEPVAFVRTWPGKDPDFVCEAHAEDTHKVAAALGYPEGIACHALPEEIAMQLECACTKGRVQEITVGPTPSEPEEGA